MGDVGAQDTAPSDGGWEGGSSGLDYAKLWSDRRLAYEYLPTND